MLRDFDLSVAPGRVGRARRCDRVREVDRRSPRAALLRRGRGPGAPRRRRRARPPARRAARRGRAWCSRTRSSSPTACARTSRSPTRTPTPRRSNGPRSLAGAHEFIDHLPEGYDTMLGEHGFSLSGGQRQRVAIARAILADPRVLILDDATSSVDPTKEHEIRDALAEVMRGRTTIIIAHRPATIALADRVVLHRGRARRGRGHARRSCSRRSAAYRAVLAHVEAAAEAAQVSEALRHVRRVGIGHALSPDERRRVYRRTGRDAAPAHAPRLVARVASVRRDPGRARRSPGPRSCATGSTTASSRATSRCSTARSSSTSSRSRCSTCSAGSAILGVARIGEGFLRDLRERVFAHLMKLSMEFYDRNRTGVARVADDRRRRIAAGARVAGPLDVHREHAGPRRRDRRDGHHELAARAGRARSSSRCWSQASNWFRRESNRAYLELREHVGGTLTSFQEGMAGVRVVQAFNQEDVFRRRFRETNERAVRHQPARRAHHREVLDDHRARPGRRDRGDPRSTAAGSPARTSSRSARSPRSCSTSRTSSSRSNR